MAKPTLLNLVQDILSDADGDEVNSVSATLESSQCAIIVRDSFRNIVDTHDIKYHEQLVQLTATSATTPCQMERPAALHSIEWIKYDKRITAGATAKFDYVIWMAPSDFIDMTNRRNDGDTDTETMTLASGHILKIKNDIAPTYFTTLEGYENFTFDAYDATLETNLQTSKTLVYGVIKPDLTISDTATINLPEHLITLLRNESRAYFFDIFKGGVTKEIDRRRRQSETRAQRKKHITKNQRETQTGPYYGRK